MFLSAALHNFGIQLEQGQCKRRDCERRDYQRRNVRAKAKQLTRSDAGWVLLWEVVIREIDGTVALPVVVFQSSTSSINAAKSGPLKTSLSSRSVFLRALEMAEIVQF